MSLSRLSLCALALTLAAAPAFAQDLAVSAGVTLVTEYEANGIRQSDGPAVQGYVQADISGFYAGIWASNVDPAIITDDHFEYDLYLGFANTVGAFSYDLNYSRYYYNNSGFCCAELILTGEVAVSDAVSVGLRFASDPDGFDTVNSRLFASLAVSDTLSLDARYGDISGAAGFSYWSVGFNQALSDTSSVFASFHDTTNAAEASLFLAGVSIDFSLR